jgi:rod shape-determining protein MreC
MSFKFFSTKLFKFIIVIAISGSLIFLNPYRIFNPVRSALFFIFSPLQKMAYGLASEMSEIKNSLSSIGQLKKENEKLLQENRDFLAEQSKFEEIGKENETLREQLKLLPREKFDLEGASIISQNSYEQNDWIEIDKGGKDGIVNDMPVIVNSGILVGKVSEVYYNTSKVLLIDNPDNAVNAVDSETNSKGVVKGEYGLGITMSMVLQNDALNKGDKVVTSGIGGSFPQGLLIGNIGEITSSADKLFQQAAISSPINFSQLRFVFVIKKNN